MWIMRVTKEDVEKMASLARLHFSEEEKVRTRRHLEQILTYVEKLKELNTKEVEPTYFIQNRGEAMREDWVEASLPRREALRNAPSQARGFFRVPKVILKSRRKKVE